jgi:hypothetical protein
MPLKSRQREGRRDTGPIRSVVREQSRHALQTVDVTERRVDGFRSGQSTSILRKPSLFAGRRRKGISAASSNKGGVSSPPETTARRPGCSRENARGGALADGRVLRSGALGPCRHARRREPSTATRTARLHRGTHPRKRASSVMNVDSTRRASDGETGPRLHGPRTRIGRSTGVPVRRVVLQKSAGDAWPREA